MSFDLFKDCVQCTRTVDRSVSGAYIVLRFYDGSDYKGVFYMPEYMDVEATEIAASWVHLGQLPIGGKHAA